jgi:AcrR family transcriptional regulator
MYLFHLLEEIMGIIIDHEARRHAIIVKAIQLFAEQGYDGVTYQKIADSCGIARTTLYKYFHNKRQIFNYAIWEASAISNQVFSYILNPKDSATVRLDRLMEAILKMLFERHLMMTVVLDYLLAIQRTGRNLKRNIARHTVIFKRLLLHLILEGMRKGELNCKDPRTAVELLYTQLEATILRLTISQNANYDESLALIRHVLALYKK